MERWKSGTRPSAPVPWTELATIGFVLNEACVWNGVSCVPAF